MFRRFAWWIVLVLPASAQERRAAPAAAVPAATAKVLEQMAARAQVIFSGTVSAIERHDAAGYVDVTFQVEHAVRGIVHAGDSQPIYRLREWSGLWAGDHYQVGQRLLMLLSGRGPSGMSAPVGGMAGVIPLLATRQPPVWGKGAATADTSPADDGAETVDLRWVETRVARSANLNTDNRTVRRGLSWIAPRPPLPIMPIVAASNGPSLAAVLVLLAQAGAS